MTKVEQSLTALLKCALHRSAPQDPELSPENWFELIKLAERHKILPLILDAAVRLPSLQKAAQSAAAAGAGLLLKKWIDEAVDQAGSQAIQENEFLNLMLELRAVGLEPIVVKGAVCRALYPNPILRPSVDDDLLIDPDQALVYHNEMLARGLIYDDAPKPPEQNWEQSYHREDSNLYLELHKSLFEPDSEVFAGWNECFADAAARAVTFRLQDVELRTLAPTDHLLFLILHAYKHFLHSGFGLRIVADVCLYSQAYAEQIDFQKILGICAGLRCERFTAAVYRIGEKYLDLPMPPAFAETEADEASLLADVLEAGLHGQDVNRLHSANIVLQTVASERQGRGRSKPGLRASLFPSAAVLEGKYPYLRKHRYLLPVAWTQRVFSYLNERRRHRGSVNPTASLRIGRERVALLEEYGVIDPAPKDS